MPVLNGIQATQAIREFESSSEATRALSRHAQVYGRIPIVAVSASLSNGRVHEYVEAGFDGWLLKPIDFQRLEAVLRATVDEETRQTLLYGKEAWERGGWFKIKRDDSLNL